MLQALLGADSDDEMEEEDEMSDDGEEDKQPASTASNNAAFLKSKLRFITAEDGQEICVDSEDNGVMMGWEKDIMLKTAEALCHDHVYADELVRCLSFVFLRLAHLPRV